MRARMAYRGVLFEATRTSRSCEGSHEFSPSKLQSDALQRGSRERVRLGPVRRDLRADGSRPRGRRVLLAGPEAEWEERLGEGRPCGLARTAGDPFAAAQARR